MTFRKVLYQQYLCWMWTIKQASVDGNGIARGWKYSLCFYAVIMEDLQDFKTLTDLLAFGEMKGYEPQLAVKRATQFIGLVHRKTWLADKSSTEREALLKQFGYAV